MEARTHTERDSRIRRVSPHPPRPSFLVRCSYLEIYCENIVDLLGADPTKKLPIKESPDAGVYVKDLCAIQVQSADELDALMTRGNNNRE